MIQTTESRRCERDFWWCVFCWPRRWSTRRSSALLPSTWEGLQLSGGAPAVEKPIVDRKGSHICRRIQLRRGLRCHMQPLARKKSSEGVARDTLGVREQKLAGVICQKVSLRALASRACDGFVAQQQPVGQAGCHASKLTATSRASISWRGLCEAGGMWLLSIRYTCSASVSKRGHQANEGVSLHFH